MMTNVALVFLFLWGTNGCRAFVVSPVHNARSMTSTKKDTSLQFSVTEYSATVQALKRELQGTHEHLKQIEILAARLQEMERHDPHLGDLPADESRLKLAVKDVKAAMAKYGMTSPEARRAFWVVDELQRHSSTNQKLSPSDKLSPSTPNDGADHWYGSGVGAVQEGWDTTTTRAISGESRPIVDEPLIEQTMRAIEAILAFEHLIQVEEHRLAEDVASAKIKTHLEEDHTPGMPWGGHLSP